MHLHRLVLTTLTSIALSCLPSAAQAPQSWAQVGALTCTVNPNIGFILVGHQPMECTFTATLAPAPPQYYDGAINTVGIDVGVSAGSVLAWGVFAPTSGVPQGALAGEYVGASGDLGIGVGAAPMFSSAVLGAPSPCNHCRCRARSLSTSCSACRH
jgi:hypothetical protein